MMLNYPPNFTFDLNTDMGTRFEWLRHNVFGKVLEIGCSKGALFDGMNLEVTGLDLEKHKIPDPPYRNFVQADARNIPFPDKSFDCAVLAEILEHFVDPLPILKEAMRVAKHVIYTVPNEFKWHTSLGPFANSAHLHFFDENTLAELFGSAEVKFTIREMNYDGWSFFVGTVHPQESQGALVKVEREYLVVKR